MKRFCEKPIGFFHQAATGPARIRARLPPLAAGFFACLVLMTMALSFFMDRLYGR